MTNDGQSNLLAIRPTPSSYLLITIHDILVFLNHSNQVDSNYISLVYWNWIFHLSKVIRLKNTKFVTTVLGKCPFLWFDYLTATQISTFCDVNVYERIPKTIPTISGHYVLRLFYFFVGFNELSYSSIIGYRSVTK